MNKKEKEILILPRKNRKKKNRKTHVKPV